MIFTVLVVLNNYLSVLACQSKNIDLHHIVLSTFKNKLLIEILNKHILGWYYP